MRARWPRGMVDHGEGRTTYKMKHVNRDFEMAMKHYFGDGVVKDRKKSFSMLLSAASKGDYRAHFWVGDCYEYGIGVKKDLRKAIAHYKEAGRYGESAAFVNAAHILLFEEQRGINDALDMLQSASRMGNGDAKLTLAYLHSRGAHVPRSKKKAIYYYKSAAQLGFGKAYFSLGVMYLEGRDGKRSGKKAVEYFKRAAGLDFVKGDLYLGIIYEEGIYGYKSKRQARVHFKRAFERCSTGEKEHEGDYRYLRAFMLEHGYGCKKSVKRAFKQYVEAGESGSEKALVDLGYFYDNGIVVSANKKRALEYYLKAAGRGSTVGMVNAALVMMERKKKGQKNDYKKALELLKKAEVMGDTEARVQLGYMYMTGTGVRKDRPKALQYYKAAAADGHYKGAKELALCYREGVVVKQSGEKERYWEKKAAKLEKMQRLRSQFP